MFCFRILFSEKFDGRSQDETGFHSDLLDIFHSEIIVKAVFVFHSSENEISKGIQWHATGKRTGQERGQDRTGHLTTV